MNEIKICDVGPRDGLQSQKRHFTVDERADLVNGLIGAGVKHIEAVSFVNPKKVPQMADPEQVVARIDRVDGVCISGLALNDRGVERAIDAGVDEIHFAVMASETFNKRNQGAGVDANIAMLAGMADKVRAAGMRCSVGIGVAFGCPFEGEIPTARVVDLAKRLVAAGAHEISLADTIGCAVPSQIKERFNAVREAVGNDIPLAAHLHNTRNTGFANAYAALEVGVSGFDASVGGIGGCPFAPRATGNIATEDLCFMLRNMGYETGINLAALVDVANWLQGFFEPELPGQVMKAGIFPDIVHAKMAANA